MNTTATTTTRKPATPHRIDRVGNVVPDRRAMSTAYLTPDLAQYGKGDRLFAEKAPGSTARAEFKAARLARRALKRGAPAVAMRRVAQAGQVTA